MTKRFILLLLPLLFCWQFLAAQPDLYLINRAKHKVIRIKPGQQLSLRYKGYLGQQEFVKQTVTDINDSMVMLGIDPELLTPGFQKMVANNPKYVHRKVMLRDITGIRRLTFGRQLLKSGLVVTNIVGTYILLTNLYRNNNFTIGQTFFISLGVGIGTSIIINALLPENPKYNISDGWELVTGYEKPKP